MAAKLIHEKTTNNPSTKPKTFLGCFRFFHKKTIRSQSHDPHYNQSTGTKRKTSSNVATGGTRWFSWSRFRINKSSAAKTVPIDATTTTTSPVSGQSNYISSPFQRSKVVVNLESKSNHRKLQAQVPTTTDHGGTNPFIDVPLLPPIIVSDKTPKQKPLETTADTIILEDKRQISDSPRNNTSQKRRLSFCRKIDSIRTGGSSQPGSPVQQENSKKPSSRSGGHTNINTIITTIHEATVNSTGTNSSTAVMSPASASLPTPKRQRRGGGGGEKGGSAMPSSARNTWFVTNEKTMTTKKKLDPLVGMTIILVTLIIMLLWGRLCAILCTAAWFYFLPRLTANNSAGGDDNNYSNTFHNHPARRDMDFDFYSDEYKKKVVLEGFLERNTHRNHVL